MARDTTWARADITIRDRRSGHVVADILGVVCEYADVTERAAGPVADAAPAPPAGEITVAEVSRYLQRTISAILRLPAGTAIDTTALFSEMGFDSLMAMYLDADRAAMGDHGHRLAHARVRPRRRAQCRHRATTRRTRGGFEPRSAVRRG